MKGEYIVVKVKEDLTGWIMSEHGVADSRLIVIKQAEDYVGSNGKRKARYLCKCNCGSNKSILACASDIKNGHTLSCGCLQKERASKVGKQSKKYNNWIDEIFIDEHGSYRIGFTSNTNKEFYIDVEDYDKVKDYCWRECVDQTGYHYLASRDRENTLLRMHNLIVGKYYDHKDRNTFNNRKYNLRPATKNENARNKSLQINNKSGVSGVFFDRFCNKWRAYIGVNGKCFYVECCSNKENAIKARLKAEADYYGEFAPQRHLFEQYGISIEEGENK